MKINKSRFLKTKSKHTKTLKDGSNRRHRANYTHLFSSSSLGSEIKFADEGDQSDIRNIPIIRDIITENERILAENEKILAKIKEIVARMPQEINELVKQYTRDMVKSYVIDVIDSMFNHEKGDFGTISKGYLAKITNDVATGIEERISSTILNISQESLKLNQFGDSTRQIFEIFNSIMQKYVFKQ